VCSSDLEYAVVRRLSRTRMPVARPGLSLDHAEALEVIPPASKEAEAEATARAMLDFAVALGARAHRELYLSTPITTGHAFVQWRRSSAASVGRDHPRYWELHREQVVKPNIERTVPIEKFLRSKFPDYMIINPAGLADIDGWRQVDYHRFWCAVIERFAEVVVFTDGWQFSIGCVQEFITAARVNSKMLDQKLKPLDSKTGLTMIADAVTSLEGVEEDTTALKESLAQIGRGI